MMICWALQTVWQRAHSRLALCVFKCVAEGRRDLFTIGFTRDSIASLATWMCLSDHIVKDIDNFHIDKRLLDFPVSWPGNRFKVVKGKLAQLEGCYLYFKKPKFDWIRTDKTPGNGKDLCLEGRGNTQIKRAQQGSDADVPAVSWVIRRGGLTVLESKKDTLITW